jgi:hypothetical protein
MMGSRLLSSPEIPTIGDLLERLGGVPAERVRIYPLPGTATVNDVIEIHDREERLCELVGGVRVEKAAGCRESVIAGAFAAALRAFVMPRRLGYVGGESGMMQLVPDLVRGPDVSFVSRGRLPMACPMKLIPCWRPISQSRFYHVATRSKKWRESVANISLRARSWSGASTSKFASLPFT